MDSIQKQVFLKSSQSRVWDSITDYRQFGAWFGAQFDEPFSPGKHMVGRMVGTTVDPEIAAAQKQYSDVPFSMTIELVEPQTRFSFRWHPHGVEPGVDYSNEATTLVTFLLVPKEGGVELTITESGFDQIPLERREKAFGANSQGWEIVTGLVRRYVDGE